MHLFSLNPFVGSLPSPSCDGFFDARTETCIEKDTKPDDLLVVLEASLDPNRFALFNYLIIVLRLPYNIERGGIFIILIQVTICPPEVKLSVYLYNDHIHAAI